MYICICIYNIICIVYIHTYIHTYIHYIHTLITYYITLHYITLLYITLHYITLHYITLHYFTLHYIALHYITLHTYIYVYIYMRFVLINYLCWYMLGFQPLNKMDNKMGCRWSNIRIQPSTVFMFSWRWWVGYSSRVQDPRTSMNHLGEYLGNGIYLNGF